MNSELKGIVLKSKPFSNKDILLTLFTDKEGKITVLAKGVRGAKRSVLYTQPFAYSEFMLYRGSSLYTVDQANIIESFYSLRNDIETLAAAQYLLDLVEQLPREMHSGDESSILKLLLNSLYLLGKNASDSAAIKRIKMMFELKFCALCGFAPDLSECTVCGKKEGAFWIYTEGLRCTDCGQNHPDGHRITDSMAKAICYVLDTDMAKAYKFTMPQDALNYLATVVENFVMFVFNKEFTTLNYYRSLDVSQFMKGQK